MRRHNDNHRQGGVSGIGIRILVVGGWSPGPLHHVLSMRNFPNHEISIVEPEQLHRWMPPFPGLWCCHPRVLLVLLLLGATVYVSVATNIILFLRAILVGFILLWCRLLPAVVVRCCIESSIQTILREGLVSNDVDRANRTLIVGFSWGGAIVAEMIARGLIGVGRDQPSVLMIAPTTSLVARIAFQKDPPLRIANLPDFSAVGANGDTSKISVVHGQYDAAFCPNQDRWQSIPSVNLHILADNHVFLRRSSVNALVQTIQSQLDVMDHAGSPS